MKCPNCDGKGMVDYPMYADDEHKWQYCVARMKKCDMCNGTGEVQVTEPKLKPCPFCGSYMVRIAKDKLRDGGYIYDVHCMNCGCGSPFRCTEEEVVEAWNKRVVAE